jgi:hypothetical protein
MALNIWLGSRISKLRHQFKVSVGDGGHESLLRRMRAQANFIENAPFVLVTMAALEVSGTNQLVLAVLAGIFLVSRVVHAIGMDAAEFRRWRMVGMMGSALVTVALIIWALVCAAVLLYG